MNEKMQYVKKGNDDEKIIRTEILLTPLLVIAPLIVSFLLFYDWFTRDYLTNELDLFGELMLAVIILIVNVMFDIPFIRSLRELSKKKL